MSKKIYFAHPVNTYNTHWEKMMLSVILDFFPGIEIENPNRTGNEEAYEAAKKKYKNTPGKSGMNYYYDVILPGCKAGTVMMSYFDGMIGAGVAGEGIWMLNKKRSTYLIEVPGLEVIRSVTDREIELLFEWSEAKKAVESKDDKEAMPEVGNELVLSITNTRLYTWIEYYKIIRPYEEAHLTLT